MSSTTKAPPDAATAHPPAILAEVRLASVRGVGPRLRTRLVETFGDASSVLARSPSELTRAPGVGGRLAQAIAQAPSEATAARELERAAEAGIRPLLLDETDYPASLRQLCDAPPVLYCRGELRREDQRRAVAIVGTRHASRYGLRMAAELAAGLAHAGVTVISGLARGVDGAAHRACLDAGGRTVAVLAGGLMRIYPPEHSGLADEVAARGALLAESPPSMPPMSGSFPQRNRIISGMSASVVVVEAAARSGALITARHAAEQGRDVFAVPGQIDNPQAAGCNQLIQEGAKLITNAGDIVAELEAMDACNALPAGSGPAIAVPPEPAPGPPPPEGDARRVWQAVDREPTLIDTLVESTGLPTPSVLALVSMLELSGHLVRVSGAAVARR
ncbi:MAG: DNA-processing protein DprA [Planctomycetota bacterium]